MTIFEAMQLTGRPLLSVVATDILGYKPDSFEIWNWFGMGPSQQSQVIRDEIVRRGRSGSFVYELRKLVLGDDLLEDMDWLDMFQLVNAPVQLQAKAALLTCLE